MFKRAWPMLVAAICLVAGLAVASSSFAQNDPVVTECRTGNSGNMARWYDCACVGREAASARPRLAQENYESQRAVINHRIARLQLSPPSPNREAQLQRYQAELSALRPDPQSVSVQALQLDITSRHLCKSRENSERAARESCTNSGATGANSQQLCACVGAFTARDWMSTTAMVSQQYIVDVGTRARSQCQSGSIGAAPMSIPGAGGAPSPQAPQGGSSIPLPGGGNIQLPQGIPGVSNNGGVPAQTGVQCGIQTCRPGQQCVTESAFGVSIQRCR